MSEAKGNSEIINGSMPPEIAAANDLSKDDTINPISTMDSVADSMKRLAVPFHKVHLVHQSHKNYVSTGSIPMSETLRKKKEEELKERAKLENKSVEQLLQESMQSRQNKINEYGYYEPEDDVIAKLILSASQRKSERSLQRVTMISPPEEDKVSRSRNPTYKTRRKKGVSRSLIRRMYKCAWTDIINGGLQRNKAHVVERLDRLLRLDFKAGKDRYPKCQIRPKFKKIDEDEEAELSDENQRSQNSDDQTSKTGESDVSKKTGKKAKSKKRTAPKVTSTKDSNFFQKKQHHRKHKGIDSSSKADNDTDENTPKVGRQRIWTKGMTVKELRKKLKSARKKNKTKSTKELLQELLDSSLFDGYRDPLAVEELYFADTFGDDGLQMSVEPSDITIDYDVEYLRRKLSKQERKMYRKESTVLDQVAYQLRTPTCDDPSKWVVVWGAGLLLGTQKSQVVELFDPPPDRIRFYVDKPYCALHFMKKSDARIARETHNGQQALSDQIIYVGYLASKPPPENVELLLPFTSEKPKGLTLYPDYLSDEDERVILDDIVRMRAKDSGQDLKNRWVKHFGFEFNYDTNNIDNSVPLSEDLPEYLIPLIERLIMAKILPRKPEQLTINAYKPGQGIPPHVDTHSAFESPIVSLSLWSDVVMDFRNIDAHSAIILPRKSLLVMDAESRYLWKHGIASRTYDVIPDNIYGGVTTLIRKERISLTFRLLREPKECFCMFPDMCDTQKGKISAQIAAKLEKEHVHEVYEEIASHFSSTRRTPWPKVKEFVQSIAAGHALLDVGCGNGKYFNLGQYIYEVGADMSRGLLEIARDKTAVEAVQSHSMHLPFRNNSFDALICIAVLHHLCTEERRLEAVRELIRVMAPGAQGLIYVWSKDQRMKEVKSAYARHREAKVERFAIQKKCITKNYSFLPVHDHETDFAEKDILVPWIKVNNSKSSECSGSEVHHRFYHVFVRGELEALLKKVDPSPRILDSYYDQGNWCVRFEKENPHDPQS